MRSLKREEGAELLTIARTALRQKLMCHESFDAFPVHHPILLEPGSAFVTLKKARALRGCIGRIFPGDPLYRVVAECAIAAALRDPRFEPVTSDELEELDVEVSVLGEMRTVERAEEIEVGKHGIFLRKGACQGLLLPQVATEMGLDRVRFLQLTCRKAGLPPDAWREDSLIQVFTAEVFCSDSDECHASA